MFRKFFRKLFSCYNEIKSQQIEILDAIEDSRTGLINLSVKFSGKCTGSMLKDPLSLLKEKELYSLFSSQDFKKVLDAILENQKKILSKKYKHRFVLIKHQFSEQLDQPLIVYKDIDTDQIYMKPACEIYSDITKLRQFNSEDSACIGYIMGCFETEKDYKFCSTVKKEKKLRSISQL